MFSRIYWWMYILKLHLIIRIFLISISSIAQEYQYFNNRLDLNGFNEIDWSYNIVLVENGYVIAGNSIVYGETIYWWQQTIARIDSDGQIEYIKYYGEDSVEYFFPYTPDYLIMDGSHFYAAGIRREPYLTSVHQEATLMYLDENLDTLWMKRFGEMTEPFDTAYYFTSLQAINQNELIITGGRMPQGINTQTYLLKTDYLGNKIWDKFLNYFNFYLSGHSIAQTSDSGFIIGCFKQTIGYPYTVDPVLIKTDSNGNQEWTKNLGGPYADNSPFVTISANGDIVAGTSIADSMLNQDMPISRINIVKLDNQGNIIWSKKYGSGKPNNFLRKIRILEDGSIIAVGAALKYNPEPDRVGWILKTTSEGDSLWYREYYYLSGYESRNYLYDVIPTNDNGLIACGYVEPYPPDTGSIDTWIIKLDSIGCDTAGCDPTVEVEEEEELEGLGDWGNGGLKIWPNPVMNIVNCRWSIVDGRSKSSTFNLQTAIMVYDIFGRNAPTTIHSSPQLGAGREGGLGWQMDVSTLPPGIYFVVVRNERAVIGTGKFVVAR